MGHGGVEVDDTWVKGEVMGPYFELDFLREGWEEGKSWWRSLGLSLRVYISHVVGFGKAEPAVWLVP